MPRTAATQDSNRLQNRRSAKLRAPNVTESTPVLFRLPAIEQVLPVPLDADIDLPLPAFAESNAHALVATAPAAALSPPEPAVERASVPAPLIEKQEIAAALPERSWWEHWSSGVVLILLIIALIAASILAFNDAGGTDPDLLAKVGDDSSSQASDDGSQIHIPSLPTIAEIAAQSAAHNAAQSQSPTEPQSTNSIPPTDLAQETVAAATPELQLSESEATANATSNAAGGLVLGNGEMESLVNSGAQPKPSTSATQTSAPVADVELLPALVNSTETTSTNPSSATLELPVGPTASQTAFPSLEIPSPSATLEIPPMPSSTAGLSPTLYDDALLLQNVDATAPTSHPNPVSSMPSTRPNQPVDTNLPAYSAMLAGASSATPSMTLASQQTTTQPKPSTQPSSSQPGTPSQPNEATLPGIQKTETPESSADAIIRAWQQFHALNQAENNNATNRYPSPTASGTPNQR